MPESQHKRPLKYSSDSGHPWEKVSSEEEKKVYESSAKILEERKTKRLNNTGEFLYGKSLKWYKEIALWPMFILLVVEIGIRVVQSKYFYLSPAEVFNWLINIVRVIIFIYLSIVAIRQFKASKQQTITAAVSGGLLVGFLLAIFQLFWYFELWAFFNLIGQPLLLAVEGAIVSWLIYSFY